MSDSNTGNPISDGIRKFLLAGVGAVATAGEKAGEVFDEFAQRGEMAVSQGRDINHELTRKASDATQDARDSLLKTRLELMSEEERASFLESVTRLTSQVDAEQAARKAERASSPTVIDVTDAAAGAADEADAKKTGE